MLEGKAPMDMGILHEHPETITRVIHEQGMNNHLHDELQNKEDLLRNEQEEK